MPVRCRQFGLGEAGTFLLCRGGQTVKTVTATEASPITIGRRATMRRFGRPTRVRAAWPPVLEQDASRRSGTLRRGAPSAATELEEVSFCFRRCQGCGALVCGRGLAVAAQSLQ